MVKIWRFENIDPRSQMPSEFGFNDPLHVSTRRSQENMKNRLKQWHWQKPKKQQVSYILILTKETLILRM